MVTTIELCDVVNRELVHAYAAIKCFLECAPQTLQLGRKFIFLSLIFQLRPKGYLEVILVFGTYGPFFAL